MDKIMTIKKTDMNNVFRMEQPKTTRKDLLEYIRPMISSVVKHPEN